MSWFLFYFLVGTHKKTPSDRNLRKKLQEVRRNSSGILKPGVDVLTVWCCESNWMWWGCVGCTWYGTQGAMNSGTTKYIFSWLGSVCWSICVCMCGVFLKNRNNVFSWLFILWNNMHYCYKLQYLQTFTVTSLNYKK